MGWKRGLRSWRFRMSMDVHTPVGITFSMLGFRPVEAILFARSPAGIITGSSRIPPRGDEQPCRS
ncbi:MAG: hypothetical protein R2758_08825 [Bacteroidales bacterium]